MLYTCKHLKHTSTRVREFIRKTKELKMKFYYTNKSLSHVAHGRYLEQGVCSIIRSGAHWRKDFKSVSKVDRGREDLDITVETLRGRQVKREAL